ncbi:MAG: GyrI-like domain-containing protein [Bacteroidota bacterium]
MRKRITIIGLVVLIGALLWYVFIKPYDYKITFETPHATGTVYSTIIAWNNWKTKKEPVVTTLSKTPFYNIEQELAVSKDSTTIIDWHFDKINDSTTKISVYLKDKEHSFMQRLKVPFTKTSFVSKSLETMRRLREGLNMHARSYDVFEITEGTSPTEECVCSTVKTTLPNKANEMIKYNASIMLYFTKNELKFSGHPILEVTDWDKEANIITYDFCFPIENPQTTYPKAKDIFIKKIEGKKALRATFNGNYRISDRAWFTLLDYAQENNIELAHKPIEVFYDNPHNGGNELEWKAHIYMPIQ